MSKDAQLEAQTSPLPWSRRRDTEPEIDTNQTSYSDLQMTAWIPKFSEEDFQSHRNVFVGIHVPLSAKHKHRKGKHRKKRSVDKTADGNRSPPEIASYGVLPKTPVDPCDRVKFILGEDDDGPGKHEVFTEMEELSMHHGRPVWKETARWLKFEEDVEEGGDKWSKPFVATLSLRSLFQLRSNLLRGTVLLDLDATNLVQIADIVLDNLVSSNQLEEENREKVREALLIKHRHQDVKEHDFLKHIRGIKRANSHPKKMNSMDDPEAEMTLQPPGQMSARSLSLVSNLSNKFPWFSQSARNSPQTSRTDLHLNSGGNAPSVESCSLDDRIHTKQETKYHGNNRFLKKIPPGAEASNVLVGEVDFLTRPIIAFVRLASSVLLGDLTEVPIPTRFLFILLGPVGNRARFHEVGRAISTLMADEVFHDVCYKAGTREDVIAGIDEFLDKVTVLPPGEWDPSIRIEPPANLHSETRKASLLPAAVNSANPSDTKRMKSKNGGNGNGGGGPNKGEVEVGGVVKVDINVDDDHAQVQCSKWPFGGLVGDVRRKLPFYLSDYVDAFRPRSISPIIASIIFIYFASVAPAITFGALLGEKTDHLLGPVEMLMACSIGNFIYAIFGGQPLTILGGTGPVLVFEDIVYRFCVSNDIPFLPFRFWIGMWIMVVGIVLVATNSSYLVRFFTRFTEEGFSVLISIIFIFEAFRSLWHINVESAFSPWILYSTVPRDCSCMDTANRSTSYTELLQQSGLDSAHGYPTCKDLNESFVSSTNQCPEFYEPNVFLMSVILFAGTFILIVYIKRIQHSPFFMAWVRRVISDFAVMFSIILWVVVNFLSRIQTKSLVIPDVLSKGLVPTACNGMETNCTARTWVVDPLSTTSGDVLPVWGVFAAVIPAILAVILIFMDQQITAVIVNKKDFKLKKGHGYHLDLLIVSLLIGLFSLLGLPWIVAATVRSLVHVQSLFVYSPYTAPGEKPKFQGVREQRVTNLCVAILLGLSILAGRLFEIIPIPLPVLYGLFLFMGVASLKGVQFFDRILLYFMPDKYKPDYTYVRHVPNRWIYFFTAVQLLCLVVLTIFKETEASIVFPIMVLLLVLVRWVLGCVVPKRYMEYLDDPLPEFMYRLPCKRRQMRDEPGVEMGNLMEFQVEPYARPSTGMSTSSQGTPIFTITGETDGPSEHCSNHKKKSDHINITAEVNKCSLFRHLDHKTNNQHTKTHLPQHLENIQEVPESPNKVFSPPALQSNIAASNPNNDLFDLQTDTIC